MRFSPDLHDQETEQNIWLYDYLSPRTLSHISTPMLTLIQYRTCKAFQSTLILRKEKNRCQLFSILSIKTLCA